MNFILFLSPTGKEILELIQKAQYRLYENISVCSNPVYFGATNHTTKQILVCTDNILKYSPIPSDVIDETIYHEGVHAAQACNRSKPLGISNSVIKLPSEKLLHAKASTELVKNPNNYQLELEAYWLEDKPEQVLSYLKKFCF
jgi:hypothetical protein